MRTDEFNQIVRTSLYLSSKVDNLLEILPYIDEIRKYHKKLQDKLEYLLLDIISYESEKEKTEINAIAIEIRNLAKEVNIICAFSKLPKEFVVFSTNFRNEKNFVKYFYKYVEITGLIVFIQKKTFKPKENKIQEELKESEFQEDFIVLDENGNNINVLPGI